MRKPDSPGLETLTLPRPPLKPSIIYGFPNKPLEISLQSKISNRIPLSIVSPNSEVKKSTARKITPTVSELTCSNPTVETERGRLHERLPSREGHDSLGIKMAFRSIFSLDALTWTESVCAERCVGPTPAPEVGEAGRPDIR